MKISERLDKLEEALMKHLEESGEIRADLKWVKKAVWAMVMVFGGEIATHLFHK